jgi:hypothetical protein
MTPSMTEELTAILLNTPRRCEKYLFRDGRETLSNLRPGD